MFAVAFFNLKMNNWSVWSFSANSQDTTGMMVHDDTDLVEERTMRPPTLPPYHKNIIELSILVGALLLRAAKQGSLVLVRALLSHPSCDLMARDEEGNTALHIAAGSGHHDVVEELAGRYSIPTAGKNNKGLTPLHLACSKGWIKCVKILAAMFPSELQMKNNDGDLPADLACLHKHDWTVAFLLHRTEIQQSASVLAQSTLNENENTTGKVRMLDSKFRSDVEARVASFRGSNDYIAAVQLAVEIMRHYNFIQSVLKGSTIYRIPNLNQYTAVESAASEKRVGFEESNPMATYKSIHNPFYTVVANDSGRVTRIVLYSAASQCHKDVFSELRDELGYIPHNKGPSNQTSLHAACQGGQVGMVEKLIDDYKCDQMAKDENGCTPLHIAAACGKDEIVRLLIMKYSCPVDCTDHGGHTPLMAASVTGQARIVRMLASEHEADVKAKDKKNVTALHYAVYRGHNDVASFLIKELGCSPDSKGPSNKTPLHAACLGGQVDMVNELINEYRCDRMARDENGCTPLHIAAAHGREDIVKVLIAKYNCPVDCVDSSGCTPLMAASSMGHVSTVKVLASELKANTKDRDYHGQTALHYAALEGHKDVISVLIEEFDCSPESKRLGNQTPLHAACQKGQLDMIDILINEYKCDKMARDDHGHTPLHIAAACGREEVVRTLISKYRCPIDCVDNNGCTPLMVASNHGWESTVKVLASELRADLEIRDKCNHTALHYAVYKDHKDVVNVLYDCSPYSIRPGNRMINQLISDLMAEDKDGTTPLLIAAEYGNDEIVRVLITEYYCPVNGSKRCGLTPLMFASHEGHTSTVRMLASELGADVSARDKNDLTALHHAANQGHKDVVSVLIDEFGCGPDSKGPGNSTPLHFACQGGQVDVVNKLIDDYKCDQMARDENGRTPLHIAAACGKDEIVRLLITKYSCPVDCTDCDGHTPLMAASVTGHASTVKVLASEFGADMETRDRNNVMALHYAAHQGHKDVFDVLVGEFGCSSESQGPGNQTPLHAACQSGQVNMVNKLINDHKCNPMTRDENGATPLHIAAACGREEMLRILITKYSCPVDCADSNWLTPLMFASHEGHTSTVKMLVSELKADVDARDTNDLTALHHAANQGHKDVVSVLIDECGCSPDSKGPGNSTPLHFACQGGQVDMVNRLIDDYKCDQMARDENGCTPLHIAAACGKDEIVRLLITKYSCPVDCTDCDEHTPLMAASVTGHVSTIKVLVYEFGAEMEARDRNNVMALHYAAYQGHKDVFDVLVSEFGCSSESQGPGNQTPLHAACQSGQVDMVNKLIVDYKCDQMARDDNGHTPLHMAAACGKNEIVRLLITKYSCPVDCVDSKGYTPLMFASGSGHASTVKMLASEFGADVNAKEHTALYNAVIHGHKDVVSVLIEEHGCSPDSRGHKNLTPLHVACAAGQMDMVNTLISEYMCDRMARDENGHTALHIATAGGRHSVVKVLVVNHGCSVDSIDREGNTPTHLATYSGHIDIVKILIDVFGTFPSIKNHQGNTAMDCNPIAELLTPQIDKCFDHIYRHGIRQMRNPPKKVLLLGENSKRVVDLINIHSVYSLPQSYLKESACFLNYVNEDLRDIWMCQYSGRDTHSSILVQTLIPGYAYTAVCLIDLDKTTDQVVDEVHSQVALIKEVSAKRRDVRTDIIICGISSVRQSHQQSMDIIYEETKRMISRSTRIDVVESMSLCLPTTSPEEELTALIKTFKKTFKVNGLKMRHGSVYLLKLLLRDFSDVPCITYVQFQRHLQDKRILSEDTHEDIDVFLKELDSLHFIVIVGDRTQPDTMMIIINPLLIIKKLNEECKKSSNPLIQRGIVPQTFLSTSTPTPVVPSTMLSLLKRFGLSSTKFPLQKVTSYVALRNTSDTFFFMPHIISENRGTRKWHLSWHNPFTIGLSLEVVEGSDLFPLEFQYSILTKTAQHFIALLESNSELEGHVCNAVWQGGTLWALDDVEVLAEVLDSGKSVVVLARSNSYCGLKCTNLVSQMGNIVSSLIHKHCSHVISKAYVVNCDALEEDTVPLATNLPRVKVSNVLHAISSDQEYVTDSSGAKIGRQKVNWLQRLTIKGQIFAVDHMDVSNILQQVRGKWRDIGRELGVSGKMLQALQDASLHPEQCCNKVIEEWLMYIGDEPSWYSLTEALRKLDMKQEIDRIMTKWGPHVKAHCQLKDEDTSKEAITDAFLTMFAEVVKPHWNLLAPYILSINHELTKESILLQLQTWKEEKSPTYGDLYEILNQLIIFYPVIIPQGGRCKDGGTFGESESILDKESDIDAWNDEEEDIERIEEDVQKQLLDTALEEGYIKTGLDVLLFIGAAGSGKSHYKHLCLGLPPPEVRDSTGLSEHPVRTMSLVRGAVEEVPQNRETTDCSNVHWHDVPAEQFIELIIEAILEGKFEKISDYAIMETQGLPKLVTEPDLDTTEKECGPTVMRQSVGKATEQFTHHRDQTEYISNTQREYVVHSNFEGSELDEMKLGNTHSERFSPNYESNFYKYLLQRLKVASSSSQHTQRGHLLDIDWIYIVDSGGQPQFREMLPILVKMASACVLTLKLNVPLGILNEVECVERGKELCKPYLSVLTNEQIVKHCSQIVDSQTKDCKLFVVGTHRDLEHECQTETRSEKNEKLLKLLQPPLRSNLEVYKTGDPVEVIFPVNSKTPKERDYEVVEQFRRAVHNLVRSKEKVNIPLCWFLLELLLHQLAAYSGILSFECCKEEAIRQLNISEEAFPTAVKFLAQKLGTIVYFPKVLPNVIFTPQALMSILSEVVKIRHRLNDNQLLPAECQGHSGEWLRFQRYGIMTDTLLKTPPFNNFFSKIFTSTDFLTVMEKMLIVARISDEAFFFPSVLEEISPEGVQEKIAESHDCLAPLVLHCSDSTVEGYTKENWLPVGSFTSLVAQLLNVKKWTLHTSEMQKPHCLYRNCIQFTLPDNQPGIVTLVDQFRHMEVYLQVDHETAKRISKVVVPALYFGLKEVHKCLLHSENRIELAFLCPNHNGCHMASIARSDRGQWKWTCKQDHISTGKVTEKQKSWLNIYQYIQDQDHCTSEELSEKQKPWFEDYDEDPKISVLMREVAAEIPAKWELFAVQIELEFECIWEIKQNYPRDNYGCFMAVFQQWNIQRTVPFTWERVIFVLRSKPVQEVRLAKNIAEKFCPSCRSFES